MKARISKTINETILIYGFDTDDELSFQKLGNSLGINVRIIPPDSGNETIGYLAGFSGFAASPEPHKDNRQCVIFSCIDGKRLNKVLASMRSSGLGNIPLKAAITAYNQKMKLTELINELEAEHSNFNSRKTN